MCIQVKSSYLHVGGMRKAGHARPWYYLYYLYSIALIIWLSFSDTIATSGALRSKPFVLVDDQMFAYL
jgi:hypothetical protein